LGLGESVCDSRLHEGGPDPFDVIDGDLFGGCELVELGDLRGEVLDPGSSLGNGHAMANSRVVINGRRRFEFGKLLLKLGQASCRDLALTTIRDGYGNSTRSMQR